MRRLFMQQFSKDFWVINMVYSIDKLDGSIVSICADNVVTTDIHEDILIQFCRKEFQPDSRDDKGRIYATFGNEIVAQYWASNICGFRVVSGVDDEYEGRQLVQVM